MLERVAASETEFESFDKREEFYDGFMEGIFPPKQGFGVSYETLQFKLEYGELRNNMDMLAFAGGLDISSVFFYDAEQFDDVTTLVLTFGGNKSIVVDSPEYGDITAVTDEVLGELCGFDPDRVSETGLIIDEVMNNEISYAFEGVDKPQIAVGLKVRGETAELTFEDNGLPFDPLCEVTDEALESSAGGNGIKLIRALSDSQVYTREGGRNRLTIIKNLFAGAKTGQADLEDER